MSDEFNFQSNVETLRVAEQQRGETMAVFFRWLFVKRDRTASEHSANVVAAE